MASRSGINVVALNEGDIPLQMGGAQFRGTVSGFAITRAAGRNVSVAGIVADTVSVRGSYLPEFDATAAQMEDGAVAENVMPGAVFEGASLVRFSLAKQVMPDSNMRRVHAPNVNAQRITLDGSDVSGSQMDGGAFDEGRLRRLAADAQTSMRNSSFLDAHRDDSLPPSALVGSRLGHDGVTGGQARAARRVDVARKLASGPTELGA